MRLPANFTGIRLLVSLNIDLKPMIFSKEFWVYGEVSEVELVFWDADTSETYIRAAQENPKMIVHERKGTVILLELSCGCIKSPETCKEYAN